MAKGDYSQSVSYLGEFSEAFNIMTKQLKEREEELEEEAYRDKLTGIGNRHLFHERAETWLLSLLGLVHKTFLRKYRRHAVVDVRVQGNLILDGCAQLISGKETQCQRIDQKYPSNTPMKNITVPIPSAFLTPLRSFG